YLQCFIPYCRFGTYLKPTPPVKKLGVNAQRPISPSARDYARFSQRARKRCEKSIAGRSTSQ
ncbi:MAG TPA: hypothetical protein VN448_09165, partial [Gammaproteobacteria bacterium]|nr:hypothetical protein [Gammaproteobacteria bacterium]